MASKVFLVGAIAVGVTAGALYTAVNNSDRVTKVQTKVTLDTGATVKLTWKKPTGKAAFAVSGAVQAQVEADHAVSISTMQTALNKAINAVDGVVVGKTITVTVADAKAAVGAPNADTFTVNMTNLSDAGPMYAQLFKGFEAKGASTTSHVAWKIDKKKIHGADETSSVSWTIRYAVCWGELNADKTAFAMSGHKEVDLGTLCNFAYVNNDITVTLDTSGVPGSFVACHVPSDFPEDTYVGFGVIPGDDDKVFHPTGITQAFDGMNVVFTPDNLYSVNMAEDDEDCGLYSKSEYSDFGEVDFTGKSEHVANCTFQADGKWGITYANSVGFSKTGAGINPAPLILPTNNLKRITLEYYQ